MTAMHVIAAMIAVTDADLAAESIPATTESAIAREPETDLSTATSHAAIARGTEERGRGHVRGVRDRYYRDSRDTYDDRDRKRTKRSSSPRRDDRARDGRTPMKSSTRDVKSPRPSTADREAETAKSEAAAKQAARQATLAEWRAKVLAEKAAKEGSGSPAVQSPAAVATPPANAKETDSADTSLPKPKVDPKEIQKRVRAAKAKQEEAAKAKPLGGDVAIPVAANPSVVANGIKPAVSNNSTVPSLAKSKVTGFGFNKAAGPKLDASAAKAATGFDDDDNSKRTLEKLPSLPTTSMTIDSEPAPIDDDEDADDIGSGDEADAAHRAAAIKRAEAVEQESLEAKATTADKPADTVMEDAEEEDDPLDAFMSTLQAPKSRRVPVKQEAQVYLSHDDEAELDAIGDKSDDIAAMMKKNKKKDIGTVDHAKQNYADFRKNFYSESVEIAEMDDTEVAELHGELDNITVKGPNPPKPIQKFPQGGFGAQILEVIRELKFEKPSSIQAQALPAIMSGRDTIGVAKTGSGKTMAFLLPMFRHIKDQPPLESMDGPIGLIMAPTRELAVQIHRDSKPFLKALNLRAVCCYGGAPIKDQIAELKRGAEIVVCTPGRMIDLLAANSGRVTNLRRVTYVVLDEADRMFDMGFEPQITKMLINVRPDRQNILFSATFPPKLESLARKALKNPVEILVGGKSVVAAEITQIVEVREATTRFHRLLQLLGELFENDEDTRCLVFVEKQETADALFKELSKKGYPSVPIHGGREQIDRDQAIIDFKNNVFPVMIATSVAARGLDVKQLKLVVNYDCPNHNEDYVHRCGRTGRAGNTGTAVTFVMPDQDRFANFLAKALTDSKQEVPAEVQALADEYKKKVDSGEVKKFSAGFGGKGIEKLDAARKADEDRIRRQYVGEGGEPEEAAATDKKKEGGQTAAAAAKTEEEIEEALPAKFADLLRRAMEVQKTEAPPPQATPAASSRPGARGKGVDPMAAARAAAASINSRVGARGPARPGQPIDNHGPDAGAFHATLEINDFPQKARWAVTNRTNTSKILDQSQVSITTKGNYYDKGKEPQPGELPKLYILVEGPTKIIVEDSMAELVRLLREGTIAALSGEGDRRAGGGRYSVV
nr:hypothetical protein B0A51_09962 [Rachicladosporium sp. CCFEE 5018]